MNVDRAISLTETIIDEIHRRYIRETQEDTDYLECISRIVSAATAWSRSQGQPEDQVAFVADSLELHARNLYIDHWLDGAESHEPLEFLQADAEETFDRLFANYEMSDDE